MDVAGDNQLNVEHEMIKQRLSKHGASIGKAGLEIIGEVTAAISVAPADSLLTLWLSSLLSGPADGRRAAGKLLR